MPIPQRVCKTEVRGWKLVLSLWKTLGRFLRWFKVELPQDASHSISGCLPQGDETGSQSEIGPPRFIAALFTVAKVWTQPKCPSTEEWMKKVWCRYVNVIQS